MNLVENENHYRTLVEMAPDVIYALSAENGAFEALSPMFEQVTGWPAEDWIGRSFIEIIHPDDYPIAMAAFEQELRGETPEPHEVRIRSRSGDYLVGELRGIPRFLDGRVVGVIGIARDITARKRAEKELEYRARQQIAVADLSQMALTCEDLADFMQAVTIRVAHVLNLDYCAVLELQPDRRTLLVQSGWGWPPEIVGTFSVETGPHSHAGYTLQSREPVIIEDLRTETRFNNPKILVDAGIVSGISVVIGSQDEPYGVLGAHTRYKYAFTEDDVHFLQAVANTLAGTIQRHHVENELKTSRDQLEIILQNIDDGISVQGRDGVPVYANAAAARLAGYASVEEFLQASRTGEMGRFQIFDEHGAPFSADMLPGRRALRGEMVPDTILRFNELGTSSERWSIIKATSVRDDRGEIQFAINVFHDITERRRAEEARLRLAAIVESSDDAIISKDLEARITSWNPAAQTLYGYSADEVVGKSISILVPRDRPDEISGIMERLRRGERINHFETVRVRKNGEHIDVSVSISPMRDSFGTIIGAATIARNITDTKRAERERVLFLEREQASRAEAEEMQRRVGFLAEASAILASSLDYEITLSNVARLAVPYLGDWCTIDVVEETGAIRRIAITHPDPQKIQLAHDLESRYPPNLDPSDASSHVLRDGHSLMVSDISEEMLVAAARDADHLEILRELGLNSYIMVPMIARDRILGSMSLVAAESGRRYGPNDLALAEDVAHRAAVAVDNARLYHQAQEALKLREEFLSIASHELRTPLTALQLQVQILERLADQHPSGGLGTERARRILEGVRRQMRRLSKLINDLLDVSRIGAGRFDLDRRDFDLCQLAREVVERFSDEARGSRILINLDVLDPVVGNWDADRLDQVITNLVSNALKYGGGNPITVSVRQDGSVAQLSVRDHGIGISSENLTRVFERFERVALSQNYGGLGLGLYIANQIVHEHDGVITVNSEPGEGTVFVVELPLGK